MLKTEGGPADMAGQALEHETMQPLQAVPAAETSGGEEKIHLVLAVGDGHKLQQALHLIPPWRKVVLVHIHRPAMMIPITTMGATVHASILKDNYVMEYRKEQRSKAVQALEGYKEICNRAEMQAETLMIENDNVAAGLLELIADHRIATLIIIGISKSWVNRSRKNLAAALQKGTNPSCNILFLQKGNLISIRQQDGSVYAFRTNETPSFVSSRRLSLSCSSSYTSSTLPSFLWDSSSTPSSFFWDSRSTPDSLDPEQLDDPSLENAGSIFCDTMFRVILGRSLNTFKELTYHMNLDEYSQELHQAFHTKYSEISNRCQFIGGIDLALGVDSENFEEHWKVIKGWPAAFEHIVKVLRATQMKVNDCECDGLSHEDLLRAAEELIRRLLSVASVATEVRKSPEKLFCILYMCKTLMDSAPFLRKVFSADFVSRVDGILAVLNDFARGTLREVIALIKNYSAQKVVQDGSILLITRYLMKYIRLLINHAGSLDIILGHGQNDDVLSVEGINSAGSLVCRLIGDLNNAIEEKSKLYASVGLRCIFLMNNAHFIIQEVEQSDIQFIVGAEWLKQRRHDINQYMRGYLSASWERVTSHLAIATSPPHKRLRSNLLSFFTTPRPLQSFASSFNETCNAQIHWKVPSPVLRYELRANVLEHVRRAYRSYMETIKPSVMGATEDLEPDLKIKVDELFEG